VLKLHDAIENPIEVYNESVPEICRGNDFSNTSFKNPQKAAL